MSLFGRDDRAAKEIRELLVGLTDRISNISRRLERVEELCAPVSLISFDDNEFRYSIADLVREKRDAYHLAQFIASWLDEVEREDLQRHASTRPEAKFEPSPRFRGVVQHWAGACVLMRITNLNLRDMRDAMLAVMAGRWTVSEAQEFIERNHRQVLLPYRLDRHISDSKPYFVLDHMAAEYQTVLDRRMEFYARQWLDRWQERLAVLSEQSNGQDREYLGSTFEWKWPPREDG